MLQLLNFEKKYGAKRIVGVDRLVLEQGVSWIRGANGAGKSTLFKALAGLIPCTGTISLDNNITLHKHPVAYRRSVNFSEAEPLYPSFLTGRDIFTFAAHAKSASTTQQSEIIERFGIGSFLKQACGTYSSGMTKRLSLAIACLGTPRVIILDEPLITLDVAIRDTLTELIRFMIPRYETVFLISSHEDLTDSSIPIARSLTIANQTIVSA